MYYILKQSNAVLTYIVTWYRNLIVKPQNRNISNGSKTKGKPVKQKRHRNGSSKAINL